jgi:3-oxoacyl-[acyl-carrier-protein] synthase-3
MTDTLAGLTRSLLDAVALIRRDLGRDEPAPEDPQGRFADLLDSMGLVEFLLVVARDFVTTPEVIEECVGRKFGTVAELAAAMHAAGLTAAVKVQPGRPFHPGPVATAAAAGVRPSDCWLGATAVRLPAKEQPAVEIDALLHRPAGWWERHTGIAARRTWAGQNALAAAAEAACECLNSSGVLFSEIGTLLVTAEAPPLLAGLAAALHHRLRLRPTTTALEVGGACTGFLTALWLARALLPRVGPVLIVSVEAPTQHLPLRPGPAGEAAALFGDAAAACVVCSHAMGEGAVPVSEVVLGVDGSAAELIGVGHVPGQGVEVQLEGEPLALRAVRTMAQAVRELASEKGLAVRDLAAVVAHGGNGRMPALLARQLHLAPERVWSETANTGNLGSASLPVAWAAHQPAIQAPVVWTAVGAGLTWGAVLTGLASP